LIIGVGGGEDFNRRQHHHITSSFMQWSGFRWRLDCPCSWAIGPVRWHRRNCGGRHEGSKLHWDV